MRTRFTIAVCVASVAFTLPLYAATVTLTRNSFSGFTTNDGWSNGKAPESTNDYVVANGYYLHGDNSEGFVGNSLQFGILGGSEGVFFKEHAGTHTFTKLILANGPRKLDSLSATVR